MSDDLNKNLNLFTIITLFVYHLYIFIYEMVTLKKFILFTVCGISSFSYADLPLTVENIIAEQGKTTLELGLTYGNNKISDTSVGGYIPVQIADTSFVNVPTFINDEKIQNEFLIASIGAKYGIVKNLDISLRSNFLYKSNRYLSTETHEASSSDTDLVDISLGANYQFLQDAKHPALVGFIETTAVEKGEHKNSYFSDWTLGFTTYRSYDPIVLSLTSGYKYSEKREIDQNQDYKPADLFFLNPQIAFAANDRISLIGGFNFKSSGDQKINNRVIEKKRNNLDYSFGMGYGVSDQSNLNITATMRQEFDNSSEIRLNYSKNF